MSLIQVLKEPNGMNMSMDALRPLFPCYWCQWAICTNVGTDCLCQDKCQLRPPCHAQVPACGLEFIIPDFESPVHFAFYAEVRRDSGKHLVPRQKSQRWVWDRFSRLGLVAFTLEILLTADWWLLSFLLTIHSLFPYFVSYFYTTTPDHMSM